MGRCSLLNIKKVDETNWAILLYSVPYLVQLKASNAATVSIGVAFKSNNKNSF
jgi:hypothetical protein